MPPPPFIRFGSLPVILGNFFFRSLIIFVDEDWLAREIFAILLADNLFCSSECFSNEVFLSNM